MPEGPSIVILKEAVQSFKGKTITYASGNTSKVDLSLIKGKTVENFRSWGKHFLICFPDLTIRIHFLLFGSYRINERKNSLPRLSLQFEEGELNFYACSVQQINEPLDMVYEWDADVMNPAWNPQKALEKLINRPKLLACDALLDQHIFSGVGNIIKNEVLFRIQLHPESLIGKVPVEKLQELISEAMIYSFQFMEWKKEYTLKKHWLAHTKKVCPRDHVSFTKVHLGKTNRRSFYCSVCQKLYV